MTGNLIVVSAPSGAGKTSLVQALVAADPLVELSVSYTTRPPRPGEIDGEDYHFLSLEKFVELERRGEFLESATIYGNRYATGKSWLHDRLCAGRDIVLEIDWQGARQVRTVFPGAVLIFILPPSIEALEQRLRSRRQDSPETIATRLESARAEMSHVIEFDYVIINDAFPEAARGLQAIATAERLRARRQLEREAVLLRQLVELPAR
jgi:guanylate kinase